MDNSTPKTPKTLKTPKSIETRASNNPVRDVESDFLS
jgi:hypothetical protein